MRTIAVIPCYKVRDQILDTVSGLLSYVDYVIVVDDCCPDGSGSYLAQNCNSEKLEVIFHEQNGGVGAAVKSGYLRALELKYDIVVKVDGDGQMDPTFIDRLTQPIINSHADYTKGNRFYDPHTLQRMPGIRLFGNSILSLWNKMVNGYWNIVDPTNGFTAISAITIERLDLDRVNDRYFFESDMLFRLGLIRAVVKDIPIPARYEDEVSNLSISKVIFEFPPKYMIRFFKRIFYQYFLRDFNIATVEMIFGTILLFFGVAVGAWAWIKSIQTGVYTSTGTVMLSVLPIILGFQLLLSAVNFDIQNVPKEPISKQ